MHISDVAWQAIAMIIYFVAMIIIGLWAYTRTNDMDDYMLGGRQLNPLVAALSAGAADMSGWLLMGLPGALYLNGIVDGWIAVGLTVGAWINWKITAPRLRTYTEVANNSITVPSFLGNRVRDKSNMIRVVAGVIIFIFFTVYVASGMVAGGKFFESTFGITYYVGMTLIAGIVVLYTLVGGFLAVSWTDMVQGLMMLAALIAVPIVGLVAIGGFSSLGELDPVLLSPVGEYSAADIISNLAWGLGYFGMPHVIVRFMALRTPAQAKQARWIGIGWMILSVIGAGLTALIGVVMGQRGIIASLDKDTSEGVFLIMGQHLFPPFIAGFMLAAVLAAIMSTISSQLLVTSSAIVEDIYNAFTKKDIKGEASGIILGRISVLAIAILAALIAWQANSEEAIIANSILGIVAFAWAGFGASFGPIVILSLYWKKLSAAGAVAGMVVGAVSTVIWKFALADITGIYEILPGFILCLLAAWGVSVLTYKPNPEIEEEFDRAVALSKAK